MSCFEAGGGRFCMWLHQQAHRPLQLVLHRQLHRVPHLHQVLPGRAATSRAEARGGPQPLAEVLPLAPERPEAEFEKAIKPVIDNVVLKYDDLVKKLDDAWKDYENNVVGARRQWEVEKMSLLRARSCSTRQ